MPFSSETIGLGTPAFSSACAPRIARVRPAQLITIGVFGDGTASKIRYKSSAPGAATPPGMLMWWNSSSGRVSRMTSSLPERMVSSSPSAVIRGVW